MHAGKCISINSSVFCGYSWADGGEGERLLAEQTKWLEGELEDARVNGAGSVIAFSHHPLFLGSEDEGEDVGVVHCKRNENKFVSSSISTLR